MKVKIGDKIVDSADEPIMSILSNEEKVLIAGMGEQTKFSSFPAGMVTEKIIEFMET